VVAIGIDGDAVAGVLDSGRAVEAHVRNVVGSRAVRNFVDCSNFRSA
jgi:hypothetical protein